MDVPITVQTVEKYTVVELRTGSLMDPVLLEQIGQSIYRLIDEEDRRQLIIDFEPVKFLSSQAIGIVLTIKKKLDKLPHGILVLCGVGPTLMQLIKITQLDRVLTIKPTQKEAVKVLVP